MITLPRQAPHAFLAVLALALAACGGGNGADGNLFRNGSFEEGAEPWFSLDTEAWGPPFAVSTAQALDGAHSAKLELRSEEGGDARVFGVVQELAPPELPERLAGAYYVGRWEQGTPKQYLQMVVIVFDAGNLPPELAGLATNHQIRYILAGVDSQPTAIANARYVMVTSAPPDVGAWAPFERDVRQDFIDLWGEAPEGFSNVRVLFEVRWDDRVPTDGPSAADVYYDALYFGPGR